MEELFATPPRRGPADCRYCHTRPIQWILLESYPHRHYQSICADCLRALHEDFSAAGAVHQAACIVATLAGVQR
jgi:hypothetical protein